MVLTKVGGGLMRPIAVEGTWRRLATKFGVHHALSQATQFLVPRQLGFSVGGGCEVAAHATRRYLKDMPPDHALVKLDFKNAFITIRRNAVLEAVSTHCPEILPFMSLAYSEESSESVQQGDPLSSPLAHSRRSCLTSNVYCPEVKFHF